MLLENRFARFSFLTAAGNVKQLPVRSPGSQARQDRSNSSSCYASDVHALKRKSEERFLTAFGMTFLA